MTGTTFATAAFWSFGLAAAGYALLALRMALGWKGGPRGSGLLAVVLLTIAWAGASAAFARTGVLGFLLASNVLDSLRYAGWFAFILSLLAAGKPGSALAAVPRMGIAAAVVLLGASILTTEGTGVLPALGAGDQRMEFAVRLGLAIVGLAAVEQLFRRAHPQSRWSIKPLVVALVGLFGFDLYLFADGILFGRLDGDVWIARGVANALLIPFVALATARNAGWTIDMHVSRGIVYQSSALLIAGVFLVLVAGAGYLVRYIGGDWGRALQIELLFASLLAVVLLASSGSFRSRLRVFVSKHFFSYRYDYREEWLRFTRTLSSEDALLRPDERAIQAIADLVESPGGALWLADERGDYQPAARLNMPAVGGAVTADDPLPRFLADTGWIVTVPDVATARAAYRGLVLPAWLSDVQGAWLIVPLPVPSRLLGFVLLTTPRTPIEVDWEVRDVLKAAGSAAAAYLGQLRATEAAARGPQVRCVQSHVGVRGPRPQEPRGAALADAAQRRTSPRQSGVPARHARYGRATSSVADERACAAAARGDDAGRERARHRARAGGAARVFRQVVGRHRDRRDDRAGAHRARATRTGSSTSSAIWCRMRSTRRPAGAAWPSPPGATTPSRPSRSPIPGRA